MGSLANEAHPRSRGENRVSRPNVRSGPGSSPLTRGKQVLSESHTAGLGLIPAHAGKTPPANTPRPANWAHPRSRGENTHNAFLLPTIHGSSPLTRGKLIGKPLPEHVTGLIPAHAGKTPIQGSAGLRWKAHPRSRGENLSVSHSQNMSLGSSPLTRGKRDRGSAYHTARGLIPAHAGKTAPSTSSPWAGWAHPRSRGEN